MAISWMAAVFNERKMAKKLKKESLSILDFIIRFVALSIPIELYAFIFNIGLIGCARFVDMNLYKEAYYIITWFLLMTFCVSLYYQGFQTITELGEQSDV